jgi:hypothetical protein
MLGGFEETTSFEALHREARFDLVILSNQPVLERDRISWRHPGQKLAPHVESTQM